MASSALASEQQGPGSQLTRQEPRRSVLLISTTGRGDCLGWGLCFRHSACIAIDSMLKLPPPNLTYNPKRQHELPAKHWQFLLILYLLQMNLIEGLKSAVPFTFTPTKVHASG